MKKAVILDTSAIMYRAFYSLMNMRNREGKPTGAVYGLANTITTVMEEIKPDFVMAAFDVKRSTLKRTEKYENYKANRKPMPEDLAAQLEEVDNIIDALNIDRFKIEGHEADDVMGTLAKKLSKEGVEVFVITGDKDLAQILDDNINICLLGKGEGKSKLKYLRSEADVIAYLGVKPQLIPDLFGLIGDSSDGIPGVRKVGGKKAVPMLDKYGNLEGIYENVDSLIEFKGVGKSLVNNIIEDKEMAFLSRDLATIETEINIQINLEELEYKGIDKVKLKDISQRLNFKSFISKFDLDKIGSSKQKESQTSGATMTLFNQTFGEVKEEEAEIIEDLFGSDNMNTLEDENEIGAFVRKERERIIIKSDSELEKFINELSDEVIFYFNGAGFTVLTDSKTAYLPYRHNYLGAVNLSKQAIQKLFNTDKKLISYKFKTVLNEDFKVKNLHFDTMIAYYLLYSNTKEDLDHMLFTETGETFETFKDKFGKVEMESVMIEQLAEFYAKRTEMLDEIYFNLYNEIEKAELHDLIYDLEQPLIRVLSSMEKTGIKIDRDYFAKYNAELLEKIDGLKTEIYDLAGEEFNIASPKQLSEILFIKMNITPVKKTKTGFSTNVEVLEVLRDRGEKIAEYILEYRKLAKLQNTYVEALPKLTDSIGRLHTSFNQTGAATGRLSSSNPNLQNIPAKTEEGRKIREGFVAKDGYSILSLDYSQIELRVLAELSEDEALINAYKNNLDLHDLTARKLFELNDEDKVSIPQRTMAKIVNFSIIYGKTAFGLSNELKITRKEAEEYIEKYFDQYKSVRPFEAEIVSEAEQTGYVRTMFKRKRTIEGIDSRNKNIKNQAIRMAVNTVIQGSAADILKVVMVKLFDELRDKEDITMNLQVHDELIFEVRDDKVEEYSNMIKEIMENTIELKNVKLEVNIASGKNWSEAK